MTEYTDPWKPISPPDNFSDVSSRRVDPDLRWGIFWGVDVQRNCLLILQYEREKTPKAKLPKLRGLTVETHVPSSGPYALLVIRLVDEEQRDIFHYLCLDIISTTRQARSEEEAIERFLARTWRWHRLLRSGRVDRLSDEEQKGLIGEMNVLHRVLFPAIGVDASVRSWMGPLDAPKDFELGRICIEAKARRGSATPHVVISNEHQLDTSGVDALFLYVSEVTSAVEGDKEAVTITDVVRSVITEIENRDISVMELFETRLMAAGFDWKDDYSDKKWLVGSEHLFEVRDQFPRVIPSMFTPGVSNVHYSISLIECEPFRLEPQYLIERISGESHES